jgi:hypothetical protein
VDATGWAVMTAALGAAVLLVSLGPRFKRAQMRRRIEGTAGGSLTGIGSGLDAVWRPSAEDAHAQWERQTELPAPAPTPGDKGDLDDGRIVIRIRD